MAENNSYSKKINTHQKIDAVKKELKKLRESKRDLKKLVKQKTKKFRKINQEKKNISEIVSDLKNEFERLKTIKEKQKQASVDGKYTNLKDVVHAPGDKDSYGTFDDYGYSSDSRYKGEEVPDGYWVYDYPYWFIWGKKESSSPSSDEQTSGSGGSYEEQCPYGIKEGMCDDIVEAAKSEIRMAGYECETVTTVEPFFTSKGYTINCNSYQYSYYLKDKGGNWIVELAD